MMSKCEEVHKNNGRRFASGFTLVELMVTVSVLLILLAIGVPQMRTFLQKRQVVADYDSLSMAIQFAKSEALKRSGNVSICPLASATGTPACSSPATNNWSNGWMIFIDEPPSSGSVTTPFETDRDTTIRVDQGTRSGSVLYGQQAHSKLTFFANGLLNNVPETFFIRPAGTTDVTLCRGLVMSMQGRIRKADCS